MKSVMLSIKPRWCEMIARGQKTIEVRKNSPKLEAPFLCYIYCTKTKNKWSLCDYEGAYENSKGEIVYAQQHIVGEFVCDYILGITPDTYGQREYFISDDDLNASCLTTNDLWEYGSGKTLYGWHISDLVIYNEPRDLENFWKAGKCQYVTENGCTYSGHCFRAGQTNRCGEPLTRPPQSWCYCEEERK